MKTPLRPSIHAVQIVSAAVVLGMFALSIAQAIDIGEYQQATPNDNAQNAPNPDDNPNGNVLDDNPNQVPQAPAEVTATPRIPNQPEIQPTVPLTPAVPGQDRTEQPMAPGTAGVNQPGRDLVPDVDVSKLKDLSLAPPIRRGNDAISELQDAADIQQASDLANTELNAAGVARSDDLLDPLGANLPGKNEPSNKNDTLADLAAEVEKLTNFDPLAIPEATTPLANLWNAGPGQRDGYGRAPVPGQDYDITGGIAGQQSGNGHVEFRRVEPGPSAFLDYDRRQNEYREDGSYDRRVNQSDNGNFYVQENYNDRNGNTLWTTQAQYDRWGALIWRKTNFRGETRTVEYGPAYSGEEVAIDHGSGSGNPGTTELRDPDSGHDHPLADWFFTNTGLKPKRENPLLNSKDQVLPDENYQSMQGMDAETAEAYRREATTNFGPDGDPRRELTAAEAAAMKQQFEGIPASPGPMPKGPDQNLRELAETSGLQELTESFAAGLGFELNLTGDGVYNPAGDLANANNENNRFGNVDGSEFPGDSNNFWDNAEIFGMPEGTAPQNSIANAGPAESGGAAPPPIPGSAGAISGGLASKGGGSKQYSDGPEMIYEMDGRADESEPDGSGDGVDPGDSHTPSTDQVTFDLGGGNVLVSRHAGVGSPDEVTTQTLYRDGVMVWQKTNQYGRTVEVRVGPAWEEGDGPVIDRNPGEDDTTESQKQLAHWMWGRHNLGRQAPATVDTGVRVNPGTPEGSGAEMPTTDAAALAVDIEVNPDPEKADSNRQLTREQAAQLKEQLKDAVEGPGPRPPKPE